MKKLCFLAVLVLACSFALFSSPLYAATWQVPGDFATIQDAIDSSSVLDGDKIMVGAGSHAGAIVTKIVEIKGESGAVINSGPFPWPGVRTFMAGFLFTGNGAGSGATISHLRFDTVEFPVFSRGADDVTVEHCQLNNPIQGVTNWAGSGWSISHNVIIDLRTANGGGIGIICADRTAVSQGVNNSIISHNNVMGTLHVDPNDGGGYDGSGIVLYADFRWGFPGAVEIAHNRIVKNKVSLVSDTPSVVDVVAIELTEANDPDPFTNVIHDNSVGFNDLRGTQIQIALTPSNLDNPVNNISRNLGNNRGQGLHPKLFGPGGN
jgi:hypothetical protein